MPDPRHASRRFRWTFAALLAALSTLGPFSVDAYLPAFAGIQASLQASPLEIQQTMSAYLFAFGVMFLFHGALSDSFGRRPVILVAVVAYTVASVWCAVAESVHGLILGRVLQGLSVGAGMVVGRAMIRDLFGPEDAQRLMSLVTLFFGLAPAIAPIIGGWLFVGLGWRSVFWFLAVVGVILVAVCWRYLPETLRDEERQPFHPVALVKGYREVGIHFRFLMLSLAAGFNFNAFFLYIVSAPVFVGEHLGLGPEQYAWLFVPCIVGIMIGAQLSGRAAGKLAAAETVRRAYLFMVAAAIANVAYSFAATPAIPWAVIPLAFYGVGFAMAMPSISLITLDLFPTRRGMAASLQGFVSGMVNVLTAGVISPLIWGHTRWLALGMLALMTAGFTCWRLYLRSARERVELPPTLPRSVTRMANPAAIGEAFRRLQGGDAAGALALARRIAAEEPGNARAHLAIGIALRVAGRLDEACAALDEAQRLDPRDHAPAYEIGVVRQMQGRAGEALASFERSARARPDFFAAHFSAGLVHAQRRDWDKAAERFRAVLAAQPGQPDALLHLAISLERQGAHPEAEAAYVHALAANPDHAPTLRVFGQYSASRGNFRRAASLFAEAARLEPGDEALPMFHAQSELLVGRWEPAWAAYARREPRRVFESAAAARGAPYAVPALEAIAGRDVTLVGEQGLGDTLFFLRWAPRLRAAGARLAFAGDARLHSLLARTGLFEAIAPEGLAPPGLVVLVGDLPSMFAREDPTTVASLPIPSLRDRLERWRERLAAAGPRPWVGALWRAGTPTEVVAHALAKNVPVDLLFGALAPLGGTVFSIQRDPQPGELDAAARALGARVHDLSHGSADLEDVLALVSLLDRHVSVSNTNLHLAAAAGAVADVVVPFPPEWRWRLEGDSPWFPGFRVHRQAIDGEWSALRGIS